MRIASFQIATGQIRAKCRHQPKIPVFSRYYLWCSRCLWCAHIVFAWYAYQQPAVLTRMKNNYHCCCTRCYNFWIACLCCNCCIHVGRMFGCYIATGAIDSCHYNMCPPHWPQPVQTRPAMPATKIVVILSLKILTFPFFHIYVIIKKVEKQTPT